MRLNQVSSFMCSLTALLFDYVLNTHIQEVSVQVDKSKKSCSKDTIMKDPSTVYYTSAAPRKEGSDCSFHFIKECSLKFSGDDHVMREAYKICFDLSNQTVDDCLSQVKFSKHMANGLEREIQGIYCGSGKLSLLYPRSVCLGSGENLTVAYMSTNFCNFRGFVKVYVKKIWPHTYDLREVAINCPEGWRNVRSTRGVVVSVVNKPNVKHPVLCKLHILPESDVQKYEKFCFIFSVAEFSMNSVQLFIEGSALEQFGFESVPELGTEYCIALAPSFDYISIEVSPGEDRYASPANVTNYQHSFMFKYRFIEKVKSTNVGSTKEEKDDGYSKNTLFVFFSAPVALLLILYLAFCTRKKRPRTLSNAGLAKDFPPGPYYTADPFDLHGRKLGSIRLQRAVELLENTTTAEIAIAQSSGMLPTPSPQDDELTQVTRVSAEVTPQTPVRASNSLQNEQNTMNKEDIPLASSLGAQSSLATSETLKDCTDRTEEQPSVDTNVVEDEKFPLTDSASCRPPPPGYNSLFSKHEQ